MPCNIALIFSRCGHTFIFIGFYFQVGILGNAADFYEDGLTSATVDNNIDRRQMMIAFDMRYDVEKDKLRCKIYFIEI